jgi:outer membrane protein OmpA-like peptidoglycan-associated protein
MINLKNLALAFLFVTTSAFAQEDGIKGLLTNDASIGLNLAAISNASSITDFEMGYGLTYTKSVNSVISLQFGGLMSQREEDRYGQLSAAGVFNLSNVALSNCDCNLQFYLTGGLTAELKGEPENGGPKSLLAAIGGGLKAPVSDNLDLGLSVTAQKSITDAGKLPSRFVTAFGLSYRFTNTEESVEWNNPLDAMYGDIATVKTEIEGLSNDTDGDGVADAFDGDNNTPEGVAVDGKGNALDVDMDGIADYADEDPFTARGVQVDANGRELDSDKDGVANSVDVEPNTESGATVNFQGKEIRGAKGAFMPAVYFDFNSAKVSYANYERLAAVASLLQANPKYKLSVIGYADAVGNSANNHKIALRRANAVISSLSSMFSIDASRLTASSKGEDAPLANESVKITETTADGQVISNNLTRMNRRVEFVIE